MKKIISIFMCILSVVGVLEFSFPKVFASAETPVAEGMSEVSTAFVNDETLYTTENFVEENEQGFVFERDIPLETPDRLRSQSTQSFRKESVMLIPKDEEAAANIRAIVHGSHPMETLDNSLSCKLYSTYNYAITSGYSFWDYYYFTSAITGGYQMKDPHGTIVTGHSVFLTATGTSANDGCVIVQDDEWTYSASQKTWSVTAPSGWHAVSTDTPLNGTFGVRYNVQLKRTANGYTWEGVLLNYL